MEQPLMPEEVLGMDTSVVHHTDHQNGNDMKVASSHQQPLQFPIGSRVVIHNLSHQPALNQHLAVVEDYLQEVGRYKVRPIGRTAKLATKSKYVSIRAGNLQAAPSSAFLARIQQSYRGTQVSVPLTCRVELNLDHQLAVRLMYSDFLGIETVTSALKEIEGDQVHWSSEEGIVFGVVTSPIHEEYIREQPLEGDELLIMNEKPAIRDLYDAMVEYELLQELETTVDAGLHGTLPLCRLRFPYQVEQA
jgi:hypothetical protein